MACSPPDPLFLLRQRKFWRRNRNFQYRVAMSCNCTNRNISSMNNSKCSGKGRSSSRERTPVRESTAGSDLSDPMPSRGILHRSTIARGYYARSVPRRRKNSTAVTTLRGVCLPAIPTLVTRASLLLVLELWEGGGKEDDLDDELRICRHVTTAHPSIPRDDERLLGCLSRLYQGTDRRTTRKKSP